MFWSGNYIVVRELKVLLKEENVTLTQVLEADDILQECKADNTALIRFLTRPDILAELITLITEEPPKNVELASQYRHANIASEVLSSNLSMLRDHLSMDAVQMNRLCDFVNKDPPLNPLLASYFSKTIEMLLERSPKQDWYLHHIVCLHVLDLFKSRRDFLPNLLRHISTSAICDTFKCFLRLGDPFNKIILEWLDEHQFLESLIQIICGTYDPGEIHPVPVTSIQTPEKTEEKMQNEQKEKLDSNHNAEESEENTELKTEVGISGTKLAGTNGEIEENDDSRISDERQQNDAGDRSGDVAAANAAALLCDIALDSCSADPCNNKWCAGSSVAERLRGEDAVRRLLQGVFTSPPHARRSALVHACRLLLALLSPRPVPATTAQDGAECSEESASLSAVERAIAPHLPLLHHALLRDPDSERVTIAQDWAGGPRVGAARVHAAALLARLALSEVDDVPTALISLGTAGVLVDMLFAFPNNNFLHAQVCALVRNARANRRFSHRYTAHLIEECNLLTRLMDAFEDNEDKREGGIRAGYMGHVVEALRSLDAAPPVLSSALQQRWDAFRENKLRPLLQRHDMPLGGVYPSENNMYEVGTTIQIHMDNMADTLEDSYDFNESSAGLEEGTEGEPLAEPIDEHNMESAKNQFLELVSQRFDDDMWDDGPDDDGAGRLLAHGSPWEGAGGGDAGGGGEEGWAQFDAFVDTASSTDPFAPSHTDPFWGAPTSSADSQDHSDLERGMQNLQVSGFEDDDKDALTILLAQKMLTAFHNMAPHDAPVDPALGNPSGTTDLSDASSSSEGAPSGFLESQSDADKSQELQSAYEPHSSPPAQDVPDSER